MQIAFIGYARPKKPTWLKCISQIQFGLPEQRMYLTCCLRSLSTAICH